MKGLWVPVSGAIAQQRNVETIANNVANANTPGFKKDRLVFREYLSAYEKGTDIDLPNKEWAPEDFYRTYGAEKAQVRVDRSYTQHNQGSLIPTRNPLDMAINGQGLFEILTPNGIRYTRRGTFTLNEKGELVTHEGYHILSKGQNDPKERIILIPKGNFSVTREGEIFVDGRPIAPLGITEFKNLHHLVKEGSGFFINNDSNNIITGETKSAIHQGFIEQSNVSAVEEMSDLIKAHRQFEGLQRVIKAYDEMAGKAANEISRF